MLAMGAAGDDTVADAEGPADALEYRRWTRPYLAIWREELPDEADACLKQGKTRLTII